MLMNILEWLMVCIPKVGYPTHVCVFILPLKITRSVLSSYRNASLNVHVSPLRSPFINCTPFTLYVTLVLDCCFLYIHYVIKISIIFL